MRATITTRMAMRAKTTTTNRAPPRLASRERSLVPSFSRDFFKRPELVYDIR